VFAETDENICQYGVYLRIKNKHWWTQSNEYIWWFSG